MIKIISSNLCVAGLAMFFVYIEANNYLLAIDITFCVGLLIFMNKLLKADWARLFNPATQIETTLNPVSV
jgi:hypothetical protein